MSRDVRAIELVGPPASGKTTLARRLAGRSSTDPVTGLRRWTVPADLLLASSRLGSGRLGDLLGRPATLARLGRLPRVRARLLVEEVSAYVGDGAAHGAVPLPPGWEDMWRSAEERGVPDARGDAAYRALARAWMERTARLVAATARAPSALIPVLAEGAVQRAVTVFGAADIADVAGHVRVLLAPGTVLVHLDIDESVLLGRARERRAAGHEPVAHQGLDDAALERFVRQDAAALGALVERLAGDGVPVLRLAGAARDHREVLAFLAGRGPSARG